eukprot:CAMPEP_0114163470 /NCGR_PEP_ID=MMETSP0043_2-20121206/30104_1 /TAXON_ID=464988 /ORGANISM="Hemiselmis andersenii, Strain CCMP644" /LENGTH=65 /DNA_ID=CAMNT_0001259971 /DNA_START=265 /DNA_END=458 /DNA_ORIENTATION=-
MALATSEVTEAITPDDRFQSAPAACFNAAAVAPSSLSSPSPSSSSSESKSPSSSSWASSKEMLTT